MKRQKKLSIGLIWAQFAAYHVDRCEAVARRFAGRADVLSIEVATTSADYAWEPSGSIDGARKVTLFPGLSFDKVPPLRRYRAMLRAARDCDVVCVGLSYGLVDSILLSWTLRLLGKQVVMFSESKFDDCERSAVLELGKRLILAAYTGAIVGGRRHIAYFRFLGFGRRPLLPGYDVVGLDRIRRQGGGLLAPHGLSFEKRPFVFVGRFVDKKNLLMLVEGFARYAADAGPRARRLVLIGAGPEEPAIRALAARHGVAGQIDLPGFLGAEAVSAALADALCLVLPSREEQWGLVVNEAMAFGLPVIVSNEVGSRDLLVRNLINGFVVESQSPDAIAQAMRILSADKAGWEAMVAQSHERSWLGDADRLADALELLLDPANAQAAAQIARLMNEMEQTPS